MRKRTLHLIGFVLTIFSVILLTSCSEEKAAVIVQSNQPASLSYHEEFDSMQRVVDLGWKAVNLSNPLGGDSWQQGSFIVNATKGGPFVSSIPSHSYKASANEHAFAPYTVGAGLSFINCWLISPALSMKNGDVISFWTRTRSPVSFPDRMQVWLNPNNESTNVGRTDANTGDFTVKLLDINPTLSFSPYPAAKTLLQIQVNAMKAKGQEVKPEDEQKLLSEITGRYELQTTPYYAAARLWIDDIIDPLQTRLMISEAISAANNNPVMPSIKLGVFQV